MKINVYCPICAVKGRKKLLMQADRNATGTVYPYCKACHKPIEVVLGRKN